MEVHHHSHTPRRKWTHYFWEFLMLFLAVTLGFFVENQREHYIEHQRAKQYAMRLYEDIKLDTGTVKHQMWAVNFVNARIDTLIHLILNYKPEELPGGTWYYYGRFGTRYFSITFQDATLQQLKNSGGLRYFRNTSVADAIARYDQACRDLQSEISNQDLIYIEVLKWRNHLYNAFLMNEVMDFPISDSKVDSFKKSKIQVLSLKKEDFIQYSNICQMRLYNNGFILNLYQSVFEKGERLLAILKKEYHLE